MVKLDVLPVVLTFVSVAQLEQVTTLEALKRLLRSTLWPVHVLETMHFFGGKDCIVSSPCTDQSVERNNLFNASNVVTCSSCATDTNVSTTGSTSSFTIGFSAGGGSLVNNVQNGDGWFTTFNDPTAPLQTPRRSALTAGERNLASATLLGGTVFFTTFVPTTLTPHASGIGSGTAQLHTVYYHTGR